MGALRGQQMVALSVVLFILTACTSATAPSDDLVIQTPGASQPTEPPSVPDTPPADLPPAETASVEAAATAAPQSTPADGATPAVDGEQALPTGVSRPDWLHTRPLEVGPDGEALPAATPEELVVRRIPTSDVLPPPADAQFLATIGDITPEIVARSTWSAECPVALAELRYLTVSFWGFDERPHTGEMIVNRAWAEEVVEIFRELYMDRFPIEEMRVVAAAELEGTPTGDTNNTSSFVCRPVRNSTVWSQHAFGLAVDINPFINPYRRGDRILPELAEAYLDRDQVRPGMLYEDSSAVAAFDTIGWGWGGRWTSLIDWMHFSDNGR